MMPEELEAVEGKPCLVRIQHVPGKSISRKGTLRRRKSGKWEVQTSSGLIWVSAERIVSAVPVEAV